MILLDALIVEELESNKTTEDSFVKWRANFISSFFVVYESIKFYNFLTFCYLKLVDKEYILIDKLFLTW